MGRNWGHLPPIFEIRQRAILDLDTYEQYANLNLNKDYSYKNTMSHELILLEFLF